MQPNADPGLDRILMYLRGAPRDEGRLILVVRRPAEDEREILAAAILDPIDGLVGDDWRRRGSRSMPDGAADPAAQLTIMSTRVLDAIELDRSRWPLAGDQLYVDLDLGVENLPAGTRIAIGDAEVEVSATPHTGCSKFRARFGPEALRRINGPIGRAHRMRGLNARIVRGGMIRTGDRVWKL